MAKKIPENFKGNSNSGRKSTYEEHHKSQAINTLWEKVNNKVQASEKLTAYEEKLVLSVLPKTIKQNVDVSGTLNIGAVLDELSK